MVRHIFAMILLLAVAHLFPAENNNSAPRKRRPPATSEAERQERRRERNRIAANNSRLKKQEHLRWLEYTVFDPDNIWFLSLPPSIKEILKQDAQTILNNSEEPSLGEQSTAEIEDIAQELAIAPDVAQEIN